MLVLVSRDLTWTKRIYEQTSKANNGDTQKPMVHSTLYLAVLCLPKLQVCNPQSIELVRHP